MLNNPSAADPAYALRYLARMQDRLAYAQEIQGKDASLTRQRAKDLRGRVDSLPKDAR